MARKKPPKGKRRIKSERYKDQNISTIGDHHQRGKTLLTPFNASKGDVPFVFNSWLDAALPDVLWATILTSQFERDDYLDLFRLTVKAGREQVKNYEDTFITHTALSNLASDDFDNILSPILARKDVREVLAALRLLKGLPDIEHWSRHLAEPVPEKYWPILTQAVAECFDHQSQKATDCRWFKLAYMSAIGKLRYPETMTERGLEISEYPNRGDMRTVRPFIRATEMTLREGTTGTEESTPWNKDFWKECWQNTICYIQAPGGPRAPAHRTMGKDLWDIYKLVAEYFHETLESTNVDARHDGAFGLVMYGIYIATAISRRDTAFRAEARTILRTLIETYITLKYLSFKDNPTVWTQYRNYGAGQAKLSYLKHIASDDVPDYVSLDELEAHANADMWMEYQDINLGAWDNKNLRKMAQEAGIKDIYDKYYDWPSGFVHANWSAVRNTTFELCLNPLHRFHRVASLPRINMNDTLIDAGKIVNLLLEELNKLYPKFKPRLKKEKQATASKVKQ